GGAWRGCGGTGGAVRGRKILLRAGLVAASEARAIGLVDEVHPGDRLEANVRELAERLTELAPLTLAAVKEATRRLTPAAVLGDAEDIILSCYLSEDFKEGVRAFLEKRKADWPGRRPRRSRVSVPATNLPRRGTHAAHRIRHRSGRSLGSVTACRPRPVVAAPVGEFAFVMQPLKIQGGSGSTVTPVAIR